METETYLIWKLEQSDNDPVWWKHKRFFFYKQMFLFYDDNVN